MEQEFLELNRVALFPLDEIASLGDECVIVVGDESDYRMCGNEATHMEIMEYGESREPLPICSEHV